MIKRKILIFLSLISLQITLLAQFEGDKWVIGYTGKGSHDYSVMHLNFSKLKMKIEWHFFEDLSIAETCSNICNANGDAILWTNGMQIFGIHGSHITDTIAYFNNGSGYWNNFFLDDYGALGFPEHDGALILPIPEHLNEYLVLYHSSEMHPTNIYQISEYLSARVYYDESGGYNLMYKDSLIGPKHKWFTGSVNATRHANGRDWWIEAFEEDSPRYYSFLLNPDGISLDHTGEVDIPILEGVGDNSFSSHGNYFARMDANSTIYGQNVTLYSFDRCSGDFNRIATINNPEAGFFTGVSFSPSEQYLYADDNSHLWQWDLKAQDIAASQTLVDTFDGFIQPGWFGMYFGPLIEASDGRIYIVPPAGSSEFMHVIDRPDLPAAECRFKQHYINLTKPNGRSAPNLPNYRLGPIDGSPCDTLGLNNLPIARWRREPDQSGFPQFIRFTDLSYFDPHMWHWDFGDGSASNTPSPLHTFEPGLYKVCLTVSNDYASDSTCQWIEILPTSVQEVENKNTPDISILPNPFTDQLIIESESGTFRSAEIQLYDIHGRIVFNHELLIPSKIFLPDFPPGVYLCTIKDDDGSVRSVKLMKE